MIHTFDTFKSAYDFAVQRSKELKVGVSIWLNKSKFIIYDKSGELPPHSVSVYYVHEYRAMYRVIVHSPYSGVTDTGFANEEDAKANYEMLKKYFPEYKPELKILTEEEYDKQYSANSKFKNITNKYLLKLLNNDYSVI